MTTEQVSTCPNEVVKELIKPVKRAESFPTVAPLCEGFSATPTFPGCTIAFLSSDQDEDILL